MSAILGQEVGVFQTKLIDDRELVRAPTLGIGMWILERTASVSSECADQTLVCDEECWRTFQVNPEN
jgi:hypothetical protein